MEKSILEKKSLNYILIMSIFVFPVFIDLFNGFIQRYLNISFSIGIIYRVSVLCLIFPFIFKLKNFYLKSFLSLITGLWLVCQSVWLFYYINYDRFYSFTWEIQYFSKILLIFIVLSFLLKVDQDYKIDINILIEKCTTWATIASSAIIFSGITKIGLSSYEGVGFGTTSFFIAINDISLTLLMILPFNIYYFIKKSTLPNFIKFAINALSLVFIASRSGTLGAVFLIFIYTFAILFEQKLSLKKRFSLFSLSFISLSSLIGLVFYIVITNPFLLIKILSLNKVSPRHLFEVIGIERINSREEVFQIFGEGLYSFGKHVQSIIFHSVGSENNQLYGQIVENDRFDLIGAYGYILGGILFLFPIFLMFKSFILFSTKKTLLSFTFFISITLFVLHSYTAGHGMANVYLQGVLSMNYFYILKKHSDDYNNKTLEIN
ncbi:MAG: O-antigen ligase family protein [Cyanobacteriota bacterium]